MKTKYINVLVAATVLMGGSVVGGLVLNNASATDAQATDSSLVAHGATKISRQQVPSAKQVSLSDTQEGHAASSSKPAVSSASSSKVSAAKTSSKAVSKTSVQSSQQSSQPAHVQQRTQVHQQAAPSARVTVSSSTQPRTTQARTSAPTRTRNTISFLGVTVPVIQGNMSITTAPAGNRAQTWGGQTHLSVTDGQSTHIIGHNTSNFGRIIGLAVGSAVTVTDGNGNTKTYHVTKTLNVTDQGKVEGTNTDVYNQIVNANQGEQVVLQTCISSTVNRLVWAR
jgi:hypothetical protein